MEMENSEDITKLIHTLSADLENPSETAGWPKLYWSSWVTLIIAMAIPTYISTFVWPELSKFPVDLADKSYWIETIFWLIASASCALCAYQMSIPSRENKMVIRFSAFLVSGLLSFLLVYFLLDKLAHNFASETELVHGRCGFFIFFAGIASTIWMFNVIRRAAPTNLLQAGFWSTASSGCAGMMFMHLVCRQENPIHLLIWHFLPFVMVTTLGALSARKVLAW
jgi:hypothetical protein